MLTKKKVISLFLVVVMSLSLVLPVSALEVWNFQEEGEMLDSFEEEFAETPMAMILSEERGVYSDDYYGGFSLSWVSDGQRDLLQEASNGEIRAVYTYDENSLRTEKMVNGVFTTFTYGKVNGVNGVLVSENRDGTIINYYYEPTDYPVAVVHGPNSFEVDGNSYFLLYDDAGDHVVGIADEEGEQIVQYEYEQGLVSLILEKDKTGTWIDVTRDVTSVGFINRIRYFGQYFDEETGWYYKDALFDSVNGCFVEGKHNNDLDKLLAESHTIEGDVNVQSAAPSTLVTKIDNLYKECINSSSFGINISYSSKWYSDLSAVEITARCIYAENTYDKSNDNYDREKERIAEGWVIQNRRQDTSGEFGNSTLKGVVSYSGAFQSITGGDNSTKNARIPARNKDAWKEAVYIACVLNETENNSYIESLIAKPRGIDTQLFFVGLVYFQNYFREGSNYIQWNFGTGYVDITDITIVGTAYNTSSANVIRNIGNPATHNIFFSQV